jgi:hypothetical protein
MSTIVDDLRGVKPDRIDIPRFRLPHEFLRAVKPDSILSYIDLICFWLSHELDDATLKKLGCRLEGKKPGHQRRRARFNPKLVHRIQIEQPTDWALHWIANQPDVHINRIDFALDYIYGHADDRDDTAEWFDFHLLVRHTKQAVVRVGKRHCKTRYARRRWARHNLIFYYDKPCRLTGELYCLHLEWRAVGRIACIAAGITTPQDLLRFTRQASGHREFWQPRLQLADVDESALAIRLYNQGRGTRRRGWPPEPRTLGELYMRSISCLQDLIDLGHERDHQRPIQRALVPLSNELWLPSTLLTDLADDRPNSTRIVTTNDVVSSSSKTPATLRTNHPLQLLRQQPRLTKPPLPAL